MGAGMNRPRRWAVAGGGTGGHVTPALALAECIQARGDEVVLIGSTRGLETRLVPEAGFELIALPAAQLMGKGPLARISGTFALIRGALAARKTLKKRKIDIVVSVGGYASVPASLATIGSRVPLVVVEPNAEPGRSNRAVARLAQLVFVNFDRAASRFARAKNTGIENLGIPLRRNLITAFDSAPERSHPTPPLTLLVFGGSQGARQINDAMIELAPGLAPRGIRVVHQTGNADLERVRHAYATAGVDAEVLAFVSDMPRRYREADLAVCRSGALTIAELAMAGLPALLVPYPFAADDHQRANALALEAVGAARVLSSRPLSHEALEQALCELLDEPERLQPMSNAASGQARPHAAADIIERCATLLKD